MPHRPKSTYNNIIFTCVHIILFRTVLVDRRTSTQFGLKVIMYGSDGDDDDNDEIQCCKTYYCIKHFLKLISRFNSQSKYIFCK